MCSAFSWMNVHWTLVSPCNTLHSLNETVLKVFWCWTLAAFIFLLPFSLFASPSALGWQVQPREGLEAEHPASEDFLRASWILVPFSRFCVVV